MWLTNEMVWEALGGQRHRGSERKGIERRENERMRKEGGKREKMRREECVMTFPAVRRLKGRTAARGRGATMVI